MPENRDELDLFSTGNSGAEKENNFDIEKDDVAEIVPNESVEEENVAIEETSDIVSDDVEEVSTSGNESAQTDDFSSKNPLPMPEIETFEEFGAYLRRVRKAENIEIEAVAKETKIREEYIRALENGDSSDLPPGVFVLAYAKRLCRIYGIDTSKLDNIFELLRNGVSYELPNDLNKVIGSGEVDESELRRRNHLALAFVALFSLIVLAVISAVVLLVMFLGNSGNAPLTENEIIRLQGEEFLNYDRLPVPAGKTGQKR